MQNRIVVLKKGVDKKETATYGFCCSSSIATIIRA